MNDPAPRTFKGVLWVARLLVALLTGSGLWSAAVTATFLQRSVATTGRVVRRHIEHEYYPTASGRLTRRSTWYVDIVYSDMHGRPRLMVVPESACGREDKQHLPIRCDDRDPPRALVDTFIGLWSKTAWLLALGVAVCALAERVLR